MSELEGRSYEEQAYEFPEIWQEDWFASEDCDRVRQVAALIPEGTNSLADIGCGNGIFLNFLVDQRRQDFKRLAGVDRSQAALVHVRTEKHLAPVDALPFGDHEFDTVTCMEVLEHLSVEAFPRALRELARVARKQLLVTVPYRQDLPSCLSTCPHCCARFNADFHVRSFDEAKLGSLFNESGFRQIKRTCLGESLVYSDQLFRNWVRGFLRRRQAPDFPSYAICPVCGFHDHAKLLHDLARRRAMAKQRQAAERPALQPQPSLIRKTISFVLPGRKRYRWICALYER